MFICSTLMCVLANDLLYLHDIYWILANTKEQQINVFVIIKLFIFHVSYTR